MYKLEDYGARKKHCGGGGRLYEVGGICVWCVYVCVFVCCMGGGGGACVRVTKCGIGGWASGWKGRQTDRQRQRETHTHTENVGGAYNSVFSKSHLNLSGECICRHLKKEKEKKRDNKRKICDCT